MKVYLRVQTKLHSCWYVRLLSAQYKIGTFSCYKEAFIFHLYNFISRSGIL
jgi:hypothetical protein